MNLWAVIIYGVLAFLLVYKIQYRHAEGEEEYFQSFNSLRGLFAIEIVIGHVIRYENSWLYPLGKFMLVSVAFFFFVSGWGLCRSFHQKKRYLNHFIVAKCGYLFMISVYAFALRYLLWIISGNDEAKKNIIAQYFQKTNWYIWELIFFYLLFYTIYRLVGERWRNILIAIIIVIFATILFYLGAIQGYYMSAFAFPAGLLFYEYFDSVLSFLHRRIGKVAVLVAAALGVFGSFLDVDSLMGMVYLRNLICLAVLGIMVYFFSYFRPGNVFLKFLGKYSTGIYIYQFLFLAMAEPLQVDWPMRLGLVLGCTLLTAAIMNPVHVWTRKKLGGRG